MVSTRDKILKETASLLWEVGYESMSPRDVMDKASVGQGSLYHHFKGKKDITINALLFIEERLKSDLDTFFHDGLEPLQQLDAYLMYPRNGKMGCPLGRLANETSFADDDLRLPLERYFKMLEKRVRRAVQVLHQNKQLPQKMSVDDMSVTIITSVQGGYVLSRIHQDSSYIQKATTAMADLLHQIVHQHE